MSSLVTRYGENSFFKLYAAQPDSHRFEARYGYQRFTDQEAGHDAALD